MSEARFIEPMPCLAVKKLPEGEGWQYELKLDGYRALVVRHERRRVLATWFVLLLVGVVPGPPVLAGVVSVGVVGVNVTVVG